MADANIARKSEFISVEIAIKTNHESDAFVKWFEDQDNYVAKVASDPHKWYIYFAPTPSDCADSTIQNLCELIRSLPKEVRDDWDSADHREFFAGYHVGEEPFCFTEYLTPDTLRAVTELNAGVGFALYPAPASDHDAET